jgi:hypothetical protein
MSLQQILTFHLGLLGCRSEETIIPLSLRFGTSATSEDQLCHVQKGMSIRLEVIWI